MKRVWTVLVLGLVMVPVTVLVAGEIGFDERFALADDRAEALKELIPGTRDYYYYHSLHYQHLGESAKVEETLKAWIKRHGRTSRVEEIVDRQALLTYETNPEAALARIRKRLGLRFSHQRRNLDHKPSFATSLNQNAISWATLQKRAFSRHATSLHDFEQTALDILVKQQLKPEYRRNLLSRITRPDHPKMAQLVVDDLNYKHSGGFGSHKIHGQLLLVQLEACAKLKPDLLKDTKFITAYLKKLHPDADVEWQHDPSERKAYYDRMGAFVNRLPSSQNSLKAHVLFHRLAYDRSEGVYDKERFLSYIKLPRDVAYINRTYSQRPEHRHVRASLSANFESYTLLASVRTDEPLVRDCLAQFLLDAENYDEFLPYIESNYLKQLFAETKVLNGVGDMERWYSLLTPAQYKALKERIAIDFLPTNKEVVGAADPVSFDVAVKNVSKLIIKTYRINTINFYRDNMSPITTAIDLDGLVANEEQVVEYSQIPQRRHKETFAFPTITEPGVYVVELIGNGKSSRALVKKGRLTFSQRLGSAGHVFRVYDDARQRVMDAALWIDGHSFAADEEGEIAIPYSTSPRQQKFIVSRNGFSELHTFTHQAETYTLDGGFYVDRETLLEGELCKLVFRPQLLLNGDAVDVGLLEEVVLTLSSVDSEGISSSQTIKEFKLFNDRESIHEFRVPDRLASLSYAISAKVKNLSKVKEETLSVAGRMVVNGIDKTAHTEDMHLRHAAGSYIMEILGKTGEPRKARPVQIELKHHDFKTTVHATLMTDAAGRVQLGELKEIDWMRASLNSGVKHSWQLVRDMHSARTDIHAPVGEPITVPYMKAQPENVADVVSLLEQRTGTFVRDVRDHVTIAGGFATVTGLEPGDYSLYFKRTGETRALRVTDGKRIDEVAVSRDRQLGLVNPRPLQVVSVSAEEDRLAIQLRHAGDDARVHVVATRYLAQRGIYDQLGAPQLRGPGWSQTGRPISAYMSGRSIGDEYRYILERKYATKYPGNMLRRPSLLLNPWSLRKTDTGRDAAKDGEEWGESEAKSIMRGVYGSRAPGARGSAMAAGETSPNLGFLPEQALVMLNLRPDKNGVVTLDLKTLGARQQIHVMALDGANAVYREASLGATWSRYRDLRMARILEPGSHFTEQKLVDVAEGGKPFVLENIRTSEMEVYDSLARVHGLLSTLNPDATFKAFSFILQWPELEDARKRELYSKYACHELSYFIYEKDPVFFKRVIKPYLANKKDKTFMDHWLLGTPLDSYLKPWAHGRLNMVERVLLGRAIAEDRGAAARHLKDRFDLVPSNIEHFNHLFKTAIRGSALAADGGAIGNIGQEPSEPHFLAAALAPSPVVMGQSRAKMSEDMEMELDGVVVDGDEGFMEKRKGGDRRRRKQARQLYRKLDKTEEWVENNYYKQPIEAQLAGLVPVCGFWKDFAAHTGEAPFLSQHVAEASRNFTEMMFAMAVLDLPFASETPELTRDGLRVTMVPAAPVVVFHKQITPAQKADVAQTLLVSQNVFAMNDRYRHEHNERFDKFVTKEFLYHNVYGCQVVLTNPTSTRRKVDVLMQIPKGALPVQNGFFTRSRHTQVQPYSTQKLEYYFYFPLPGEYAHFPVHVSQDGKLLAYSAPFAFNVVEKLTTIDKASWDYISQFASADEVVTYLESHNVDRLNLDLIAFRVRDRAFFDRVIPLLESRHAFNSTLWSYGLHHNVLPVAREYLQHSRFANMVGAAIESPLLTVDPIARYAYQHKEYWPLVNARTYQLGAQRKILNAQFFGQYMAYMRVLRYRPELADVDEATVAYYMFLQDRVEEGLKFFDRADREHIPSLMHMDYMEAYAAFYRSEPKRALQIAKRYENHEVDRWRNRFAQIRAQAEEITGGKAVVVDKEDRDQLQARLADTAPSLDFKIEDRELIIASQNLKACEVNYYLMDIELLFSKKPFVQGIAGQFSVIEPNKRGTIELKSGKTTEVELPREFRDHNVMVELVAGGIRRSVGYYPHSLAIQLTENYGQVRVSDEKSGKPIDKVYVKVYARMQGGAVTYFKDGYTDLRGRFDYTSLNTDELDRVERLAILIMSETHGAVIREAAPPKR